MDVGCAILCPGLFKDGGSGIYLWYAKTPPHFYRTSDGTNWKRTNKIQKGWSGLDENITVFFYKPIILKRLP